MKWLVVALLSLAFLAAPLAAGAQQRGIVIDGPAPPASPGAAAVDLTATYVGTLTGSASGAGFEARITASIVQAGDRFLGTWAIFQPVFREGAWTTSAAFSGTITGSVIGRSAFNFEVRQARPCAGVLRGSGAIKEGGAVLEGSYAGATCHGEVTASFHMDRRLDVRKAARWAIVVLPRATGPSTATALSLTIPPSVLARADEVIE